MQTTIYALCEPGTRTVRYIGKTVDLKRRVYRHLTESSQGKNHLGNWLRSLLVQGRVPSVEILDEVPEANWEFFERAYIRVHRESGFSLTNGTDGGDGASKGRTVLPETRAKLSAALMGHSHTPESCAKMSASHLGVPLSAEHRASKSAAQSGEKNHMFGRTGSKNSLFEKKTAGSSSRFLGVCWDASRKKWATRIRVGSKTVCGRRFEKEIDAARFRDELARKFHGKDAVLNFPTIK